MTNSQRAFVNTIAQYCRTLVYMFVSLYTVRVVLRVLGASDFGIYTLIAGVVTMLSFVSNSLISSTQRFISYYQGKGDIKQLVDIYNNSMLVHIALGLIVGLILELLSPFLFSDFLNIPPERMNAAKIIYQVVIGILFITFITAPYKALIISHENIVFISIVEIVEGFVRVGLVIMMSFVTYDKLIFYSLIMLLLQFLSLISFAIYSHISYKECVMPTISGVKNGIVKELLSFSAWNTYSSGCYVGQKEGIAIALNRIMGTSINAAYGIGFQLSGYTTALSGAISNAIKPQLTKAEGSGDRDKALWLSNINSKFVYFLTAVISIPALFEVDELLNIWLGDVPEYSNIFCTMAILSLLVDSSTIGLSSMNSAVGKIKYYCIIMGTPKLMTFPISYWFLNLGMDVGSVVVLYVSVEAIMALVRIPYIKYQAGLDQLLFIREVLIMEFVPSILMAASCFFVVCLFNFPGRFLLTFLTSSVMLFISVYYWGLTSREKSAIVSMMKPIFAKIKTD